MKRGVIALLLLASIAACRRQPTTTDPGQAAPTPTLTSEERIARATLRLLASDGTPVCVEPETFGSPLSIWHVATAGKLQRSYDLAWAPPKPFRPPNQPTLGDIRKAAQEGEHARIVEPDVRSTFLPAAMQKDLQAKAAELAPPHVAAHRVSIRKEWAPAGVVPRWWPDGTKQSGCDAQYVLSGIKWNAHVAFVSVRVEHWGTVFALAPQGDDWRVIGQWGTWLY